MALIYIGAILKLKFYIYISTAFLLSSFDCKCAENKKTSTILKHLRYTRIT